MRDAANVGCDIGNPAASQYLKREIDRSQVGDLKSSVDVNLKDLTSDGRKQKRVSVVGNVRAASLELAFFKRLLDRRIVVPTVVNDGRIIEGEILHPDSRPRFRKPAAHSCVDRPGQLVGLNQ